MPAGARVLEVGSGTGRDADYLEARGAHVRRTDATPAFVALQAERGKHAERLDMLSDDLGGPYDAVLALCVLIHVERARTDAVLRRIADAARGVVLISVREGEGERSGECHMTYWSRDAFAARLARAGLRRGMGAASRRQRRRDLAHVPGGGSRAVCPGTLNSKH